MLRKLGQVALSNLIVAAFATVLLQVVRHDAPLQAMTKTFPYCLVYSFCIGTIAWLVMGRVMPLVSNLSRTLRIASLVVILAMLALVGSLLANLIFLGIGWVDGREFWAEFGFGLRIAIFLTFLVGAATTVFEVLWCRLQEANEELRRRQREHERARQLITEARLSSLESRIHPHFLFNTLNSISALIREDPRQAERTVERLAVLLRYSLDHHARGLVPLEQELRVVEDYLEIEKTRFGDRLRFTLDVPGELADLDVPPLALQTLVENSIKHAVAPSRQGGEIRVTARLASGSLVLEVSDDGPGFERQAFQPGHGLENLQERLTALFEGEGRIETARQGNRTVVGVVVPQKKVLA
jgi:two-component system LytT family sensor kinase